MLFLQATVLFILSALASSAPTEKRWFGGANWWTHHASASSGYLDFGRRWPGAESSLSSCSLSGVKMPASSTPLPAPADGLTLSHVAIGRGTQNYTCDLSNATAVPAPVGALATLFNVTCLAASAPDLLSILPSIALELPVPSSSDVQDPINQDMSGHHYFIDLTTAFFNMDTSLHQYGSGAFKKVNAVPAPATAPKGQYGRGDGAVAWLKLDAKNDKDQIFQQVYRLNTAGGNPPKTCKGQKAAFEVQYAAEYWLFE
ncbi:Hypothetical protein R9X50_00638700 [Acrodontium crateriforme]|uniref:Malate dehydrogenase n=1 Tax=Acrodontium crateriforme TaxID=150365 RepID=A0AAQ3M7T7_9PEZI|nr:Hypothetical protein R9X50_00638700 [Acrodontium crateriforme]